MSSGDSLTVERRAQRGDAGSNPSAPLHFRRVELREVSRFIKTHHYSHTHPAGVTHAFALYWHGELAGACIFGYMAGNQKVMGPAARELMRLVLLDAVPPNSESLFVGWCIRQVRKDPTIKLLVSFADPEHNHVGIIYKATNWHFVGKRVAHRPRMFVDGKPVHPRTMHDRYGSAALSKLRPLLGDRFTTLPPLPKLRFEYDLR